MPGKLPDAQRRRQQTLKLRPDLIGRWEAAAKRLGVTKTAFAERALEAALGDGAMAAARGQQQAAVVAAADCARVLVGDAPAVSARSRAPAPADRAAAFRAAEAARRR